MGFELVQVQMVGGRLQVMIERADGGELIVDQCADASHAISALLDVADPISSSYVLEVSSPGIDRPLVRRKDFERFSGFEARIEMTKPIAGRRRFRGRLLGIDGEAVKIDVADGEVLLPMDLIKRAKLVLTDELIRATEATTGH